MSDHHTVEICSAGCSICDEATQLARRIAADTEVSIRDMKEPESVRRAAELGVRSIPAVAVDGRLADCCSGRGLNEETLRAALPQ